MAGNVEEWCEDRYHRDAYRRYAGGDLKLPLDGEQKVLRGGTWDIESPLHFRCADRYSLSPGLRYNNIGFRCARDAMPGSEASPAHE